MSAELLHSLVDDNADFRKQKGTSTGRYEHFDGRIKSNSRLPSGYADFIIGKHQHNRFQDSFEDSKRYLRQEKCVNRPADVKESLRVLAGLREARANFNKGTHFSHSSYEAAYDRAPRHSFDDGRLLPESNETIWRLRDLPRLSLDSREPSMLSSRSNINSNSRDLKGQPKNTTEFNGIQKRPTSVVAKLMGLEPLPDPVRTVEAPDFSKRPKFEPELQSWKLHGSATKAVSGSRFPIESAPWKQQIGRNGEFHKSSKVPTRQAEAFLSNYGEIERRLKDIEFKQSGKDLSALRRILEAMRAKGFLEAHQNQKSATVYGPRTSPQVEGESDHFQSAEPTIVIMKPAKLVGRDYTGGTSPFNSFKDQPFKDNLKDSLGYIDKRHDTRGSVSKEHSSSHVKSSGSTISPRLQQKRLESDNISSTLGCKTSRESKTQDETRRLGKEDGPALEEDVSALVQHPSPVSLALDVPKTGTIGSGEFNTRRLLAFQPSFSFQGLSEREYSTSWS